MGGLAIILGAGASYDCAEVDNTIFSSGSRPPLVSQLFQPRFAGLLAKYPLAASIADRIRDKLATQEGLESILRHYALSSNPELQRKYWQIPLYLQELFGEVAAHFGRGHGTKFDTMVDILLSSACREAVFITTNYDTFLEAALQRSYDCHFDTLSTYCKPRSKWALVKLHGSVNWGRRFINRTNEIDPVTLPVGFVPQLGEVRIAPGYQGPAREKDGFFYYPALAPPIDGKTFLCPDEHIQEAKQRLRRASHWLVIGFSGLDRHVLDLLIESGGPQYLRVVCESEDAARATIAQFARAGLRIDVPEQCFSRQPGFHAFIRSGEFEQFVAAL